MVVERLKDLLPKKERGHDFYPSRKKLESALEQSPHREDLIDYVVRHGGSVKKDLLRWPRSRGGQLTDVGILRHMLAGNVRIEPFNIVQLQPAGYDVRVSGRHLRMKSFDGLVSEGAIIPQWSNDSPPIYDPYSQNYIGLVWAEVDPVSAAVIRTKIGWARYVGVGSGGAYEKLDAFMHIKHEDELIFLQPGEMILAHTMEEIGGSNVVTTMIAGKSTTGRHGFEVCSDAFLGDPGFSSRWVLEIANKHPDFAIYLARGTPVATVVFNELTEPPLQFYKGDYHGQGQEGDLRGLAPKPMRVIRSKD